MEFTLPLGSPFSLEHTLNSGQAFRWRKDGEWWCGVVSGGVAKARQEADRVVCRTSSDSLDSSFLSTYFGLDVDLGHVLASIANDPAMISAIERFYGLRLMRQDRWECLASFVLATNANIPRIQKMVSDVCAKYGRPLRFEGEEFHAFPAPGDLAQASVRELRGCGLGYRAPFLKRVAGSVARGLVDFERVASLPYEQARALLVSEALGKKVLLGVGPKVADCVLLYSFGKDEAFPIDVWVARAISASYPGLLGRPLLARLRRDGKAKLTPGEYEKASASARRYFGSYAGYAQQYLFMAARASGG